jgi:hypothetical protein
MSEGTGTSQSGTILLTILTIIRVYLPEKRDRMLKTMHIWMLCRHRMSCTVFRIQRILTSLMDKT